MKVDSVHRPTPVWHRFSTASASTAIVIGILVLSGWLFDLDRLKRIAPGMPAMNPMTASLLILSGLCLLAQLRTEAKSSAAKAGALFGLIISVAGLFQLGSYLSWWRLELGQLLFPEKLIEN